MNITQQDLERLSTEELNNLMSMIKKILEKNRDSEYSEARKKIDDIAQAVGLSATDLLKKTEKPTKAPLEKDYYP